MAYRDEPGIVYYVTCLLIFVFALYGWVSNILILWNSFDSPLTAKMIVRIAGIFVTPLGIILGYL
jgi:hypothetical protein